jgi:hypothetical protein
LLAGVAEQIHTLWGDEKYSVRQRDMLWVKRDEATPAHVSYSSQNFIQYSEASGRGKICPFGAEGAENS